jgi:hypothetical protein
MGLAEPGALNVSTETWIAEIFSPPYMYIDVGRQVNIQSISAEGELDYTLQKSIITLNI